VVYLSKGHSYSIEGSDHIDLHDNIAIGTLPSWTITNTDTTPASFFIANPLNHIYRNHAAGSDWHGFWYALPDNKGDRCPQGLPLGLFDSNVAHSNRGSGLKIDIFAPRAYPCLPTRNDQLIDPFAQNPSIPATFSNFITFANRESGVFGESLGTVTFDNFFIADFRVSGM